MYRLNEDGIRPEVAATQQIIILFLAGVMFCGVPLFFLGLKVARKFRIRHEGWILITGTFVGVALMSGILWLIKSDAGLFAFPAAPAFFYGVWYGGRENERKNKEKRSGGRRGRRSRQNAWGTPVRLRGRIRRK